MCRSYIHSVDSTRICVKYPSSMIRNPKKSKGSLIFGRFCGIFRSKFLKEIAIFLKKIHKMKQLSNSTARDRDRERVLRGSSEAWPEGPAERTHASDQQQQMRILMRNPIKFNWKHRFSLIFQFSSNSLRWESRFWGLFQFLNALNDLLTYF